MTMRMPKIGKKDEVLIDALVRVYQDNEHLVRQFLEQIRFAIIESEELKPLIHSIRGRLKDHDHLRHKLRRRILKAKKDNQDLGIDKGSLLVKINDLAGLRILHLHTRQIADIDKHLRGILQEQQFKLIEGPFARTWDDESKAYFEACGIRTQPSASLYTSVHYVIESASRTKITCELQVRTLMEEVWGEVDHLVNYPDAIEDVPCTEQLKVLARATSTASRLVDSIFSSHADFLRREGNSD